MGLFKKNVDKQAKPTQVISVNGKNYVVEETTKVNVQSSPDDIVPYGWTLEMRTDSNSFWFPYWNSKIYQSRLSAISASVQIGESLSKKYEFRVSALYRMDTIQYRNITIDKLLSDTPLVTKYPLKFWKVIDDVSVEYKHGLNNSQIGVYEFKKGTLYIQMENGNIFTSATPTKVGMMTGSYYLKNVLIPKNYVSEIDIMNEKWYHPHLPIELKEKLNVR